MIHRPANTKKNRTGRYPLMAANERRCYWSSNPKMDRAVLGLPPGTENFLSGPFLAEQQHQQVVWDVYNGPARNVRQDTANC